MPRRDTSSGNKEDLALISTEEKITEKSFVKNIELPQGDSEIFEKVVAVNRCAKVVAGGRRFSFSALCVAGDKKGHVGIGLGKANEVADSIRKGLEQAKKNMIGVNLKGSTIPYESVGEHSCSRVVMRPAGPGTGIKATLEGLRGLCSVEEIYKLRGIKK